MASFCDLPEGLVMEILLRLPPESLVKFKYVQKSWRSIINNEDFTAKYLNRIRHNGSQIFLTKIGEPVNAIFSINNAKDHNDIQCSTKPLYSPLLDHWSTNLTTAGSHCDGIICLPSDEEFFQNDILLFNPTTKQLELVKHSSLGPDFSSQRVGFGYDPIARVYKLVRIMQPRNTLGGPFRAEVCVLGGDSWREIKVPSEIRTMKCLVRPKPEVYCKGVYYWLAQNLAGVVTFLSFDMHGEEFRSVPFQVNLWDYEQPRSYRSLVNWRLVIWEECVALIWCPNPEVARDAGDGQIWVLNESAFRANESLCWTRRCFIPSMLASFVRVIPIAFLNSKELLMRTRNAGFLMSMNVINRKFRVLDTHRFDGPAVLGVPFAKSLTWFN